MKSWVGAHRREICIWLGFLVFAVLALFPPWRETLVRVGDFRAYSDPLWHAPLFRPPPPTNGSWHSEVDYRRMFTEIAIGEGLVLALYSTWGQGKRK
jgi:hypothetical protein